MRLSWIVLLTLCSAALAGSSSQYVTVVPPLTMSASFVAGCRIATGSLSGCLSAADWTTFNAKQSALTIGNLTSGTTGLSITGGTGAVIGGGTSLSIQTASGSQPGLLSAADWTTFNAKQTAGSYITALTGEVQATGPGSSAATILNSAVIGKLITGFVAGAGSVSATDTILQAFNKIVGNIALLAPLASPTFTGTVTAPNVLATTRVSSAEYRGIDGNGAALYISGADNNNVSGNGGPIHIYGGNEGVGGTPGTVDLNSGSTQFLVDSTGATLSSLTASMPVVSDSSQKLVSQSYPTFTSNLSVMQGDGGGGAKGLVPAQASGDAAKFLRGDGVWATAGGGSVAWGGITGNTAQALPSGGFTGDLLLVPAGGSGGVLFSANGGGSTVIGAVTGSKDIFLNGGTSTGHLQLNTAAGSGGGSVVFYTAIPLSLFNGHIGSTNDNTWCVGCDNDGIETGNRFSRFVAGTSITTPVTKHTAAQTTLTGSAGTAVCSQPEIGSSYKKVLCYLSGYSDTGTQDYTFPTAFSHAPDCRIGNGQTVSCTASTTTVHFTAVTQTGFVFVEGY